MVHSDVLHRMMVKSLLELTEELVEGLEFWKELPILSKFFSRGSPRSSHAIPNRLRAQVEIPVRLAVDQQICDDEKGTAFSLALLQFTGCDDRPGQ